MADPVAFVQKLARRERCSRCGRFMVVLPEREMLFEGEPCGSLPPVAVCSREACSDAEEAASEAAFERSVGRYW